MDPRVDYMDLTLPFSFIWAKFMWVVDWMQTHGIIIWDKHFTFFDCAVGIAGTAILISLIPIFGDPEDQDYEYDDFGGW